MAILLLETLHPDAESRLKTAGEVIVAETPETALQAAARGDIQAILTRGKGKVTQQLIDACGETLMAVSRCGAGLDTIDVPAAQRSKLSIVYAPGKNADTTAEHTLMLMLSCARRLPHLNAEVKAGRWAVRNRYEGIELRGKTLGIVGLGAIGKRVGELANAFGMKVTYWSRNSGDWRFQRKELDDLLAESDVVSVHVALTADTKSLIDADRISIMKPGALLINTSRGAVLDQKAVAQSLASGHLGGFAADVLDGQPPADDDLLLQQDRAVLTPHAAGLTDKTYREVCLYCANNVLAVLDGSGADPHSLFQVS
jgi:D-3-phosphoglycerate dehydrogenase / 2-oxoglutarate reductase